MLRGKRIIASLQQRLAWQWWQWLLLVVSIGLATPVAAVDLAISLDDHRRTVAPTTIVDYVLTVTNTDAGDAGFEPGASLTTRLDPALSCNYVATAVSGTPSGFSSFGAGDINDTLSLTFGDTLRYDIDCVVDSSASGPLTSDATIVSSTPDINLDNNVAQDLDTVVTATPDTAFANDVGAPVRLCLGDGDGIACQDLNGNTDTHHAIDSVDADGDGDQDLVIAVIGLPNQICLNDGTATFVCSDISSTVDASLGVAVGFLDGDSVPDVVFANGGQNNEICFGVGDGSFNCFSDLFTTTNLNSEAVALGDVDRDGNTDIVVANDGQTNQVCLYVMSSPTDFWQCAPLDGTSNNTWDIDLADFNKDGILDVVEANGFAADRVCLGSGFGSFSCSSLPLGTLDSEALAVGHLNPNIDLHLDLLIATGDGTTSRYCLGNGTGIFTCANVDATVRSDADVSLGDMDGNGTLDVVFAVYNDNNNQLCLNDGNANFSCLATEAVNDPSLGVVVDEFDGVIPSLADLRLSVSSASTEVIAGDGSSNLIYTITLENVGTVDATTIAVSVTPELPDDVTQVSAVASRGTFNPTWHLDDLPAGQSATLTLTYTVGPDAPPGIDVIQLAVDIAAVDQGIIVDGDNTATIATTVTAVADLSISKTDGQVTYIPGSFFTYAITVANPGPSSVTGAQVQDIFPNDVSVLSWTCNPSGGTASCDVASGSGNLDESVNMAPGGSVVFSIQVQVDSGATIDPLVNTATVIPPSNVNDPNTTNNAATDTSTREVIGVPEADLSLTKTVSPTITRRGESVVYTLVVRNNGPDLATAVILVDDLPAGLTVLNIQVPGGNCAEGSCSLGNLAVNDSAAVTITAQVEAEPGTLVNTATIGSNTEDPNAANNLAVASLRVEGDAPPPPPIVILPTSNPLPDATVGVFYQRDFTVSGGTPPYQLMASNTPPGLSFSLAGNALILSGTPTQASSTSVAVTVADQSDPSQMKQVIYSLRILPAPVANLLLLPEDPLLSATVGEPFSARFSAADGTPPYQFSPPPAPPGLSFSIDEAGLLLSGVPTTPGSSELPITVSDVGNPGQTVSRRYTLDISAATDPLALLPPSTVFTATLGQSFEQLFTASGGTPPYQLTLNGTVPGLTTSSVENGLILTGIATEAGSYPITVTVVDSHDPSRTVSLEYTLQISINLALLPETLPVGFVGEAYAVSLDAVAGIPPFDFSVEGLPPGLGLVGNTITGVPQQNGSFPIAARLMDRLGNQARRDYNLEIRGIDEGLLLTGVLPVGTVDAPFAAQFQTRGGEPPYAYSSDSPLPDGLNFSSSGRLAGTPEEPWNAPITVTVRDRTGREATLTTTLEILSGGLVLLSPPFPDGRVGQPYSAPILIGGGKAPYDCDPVPLEGRLPLGLAVQGCAITGIPGEAGNFDFSLLASDAADPVNRIAIPGPIRIVTDTPIPEGTPPVIGGGVVLPVPEASTDSPGDDYPDESLQQGVVDAYGHRYLVGYAYNGDDYDIRLLVLGDNGELLRDQRFDFGSHDYGYAITIDPVDQGLYLGGLSLAGVQYQGVLLKLDFSGQVLWQTRVDDGPVNAFYSLHADSSGVFAVGERYNGDNFDALLSHFDRTGGRIWQQLYASNTTETAYRVAGRPCPDRPALSCELLVAGAQGENQTSGWLLAVSPEDGSLGNPVTIAEFPVLALVGLGQDWVIGGSDPTNDWRIRRLDPSLNTRWETVYPLGSRLRAIARDAENNLLVGGSAAGDAQLVILASDNGAVIDDFSYDSGAQEVFTEVLVGPEGTVTGAGERFSNQNVDILLLEVDTGKAF